MFIDYLKEGKEFLITEYEFEARYPFHSLHGYVVGWGKNPTTPLIQVACHVDEDPQDYQKFKNYDMPWDGGPIDPTQGMVCYITIDGIGRKQELRELMIDPNEWHKRKYGGKME